MKRVLILGAGHAQVDAINYCKNSGFEVVGCSYTTIEKGIKLLDYFENIDIKDVEAVTELALKYNVDLIYSVGSDVAMPTIMKVSEKLGLPHFVSSEITEICVNKALMREQLGIGFPGNVSFEIYSSLDEAIQHDRFPAMMKPIDSQGQRGCYKIENTEDIIRYFDSSVAHSIAGKVIIEDYARGQEVSVNAYLQGGVIKFMYISDRHAYKDYPGGIVKSHVMPSALSKERIETIESVTEKVVSRMGIENGPCYIQMKVPENGDPTIIELSPRLDGCHIWKLIKYCYGTDLLDISFKDLLGAGSATPVNANRQVEKHTLEFISKEPHGTFHKNEYELGKPLELVYYYEDGERVCKTNGFFEKCGYVIR